MTDLDLLLFGAAVSFIVIAGFYVFARERFLWRDEKRPRRDQPLPVTVAAPRTAERTRRSA